MSSYLTAGKIKGAECKKCGSFMELPFVQGYHQADGTFLCPYCFFRPLYDEVKS